MPVLDVLIPHYNDVRGLKASLASIEAQEWSGSLRVVVVDDGSEKSEKSQLYKCLDQFSLPTRLVEHSANKGRPAARNTALLNVEAPYLAWLDAGDIWYPSKLTKQFKHLRDYEDQGLDSKKMWVSCHYDWEEQGKCRLVLQDTSQDLFTELMMGNRVRAYLWTLLGRTEAFASVGLFDESLPRMQDLDYFLRFARIGGSIAVPRERKALCRYYKTDQGRKHSDIAESTRHIYAKYEMELKQAGISARVANKNASLAARFARNNGHYLASLGYKVDVALRYPRYTAYRIKKRILGS